MKAVKFVSALCIVILLSIFQNLKVSGQEKPSLNQNQTTQNPTQKKIDSDETKDFNNQTANMDRVDNRYRIGYEDKIVITVIRHAELSLTTSLNSDGTIFMPQIEQPIVAVCKTELELKQTIQNLYKTNILRNPFVNVQVVDQRSQPFAVIGAAEKPGSFYLNQKIQLLGLIALAGGPDVERSPSKVRIARVGNVSVCEQDPDSANEDSKVEFITYKLSEVMDGTKNPWMQPGDVVSILEADEAYVVGNVFKPEKISLREPKSLMDAIAIAGGLDATAKTDKVIIQRQEAGKINRTELVFDINEIRNKKIPDPQLQANDIVEVNNDNLKSIKKGLLKAIIGGVPNVFYRFP